jgi:phage tail protein X
MTTYITVQGDTWDVISYRVYGDEGHMGALIEANPGHTDIVIFPAGIKLIIPAAPEKSPAANLPPWRT